MFFYYPEHPNHKTFSIIKRPKNETRKSYSYYLREAPYKILYICNLLITLEREIMLANSQVRIWNRNDLQRVIVTWQCQHVNKSFLTLIHCTLNYVTLFPLNFANIFNFVSLNKAQVKIKECAYKYITNGNPITPFLIHCYYYL